jgi:hypothetical protein
MSNSLIIVELPTEALSEVRLSQTIIIRSLSCSSLVQERWPENWNISLWHVAYEWIEELKLLSFLEVNCFQDNAYICHLVKRNFLQVADGTLHTLSKCCFSNHRYCRYIRTGVPPVRVSSLKGARAIRSFAVCLWVMGRTARAWQLGSRSPDLAPCSNMSGTSMCP